MGRIISVIAAILLALAVAGYLYFSGKHYEVRIPQAQIQQKLAEKLPLTKTYLQIFQITLDNPRVELLADSGRIKAGLDLALNIRIGPVQKPLGGSVDASGTLKYVAGEGQFYLSDPIIEQLSIQGLPERQEDRARAVIEMALSEYFATRPVYTLKASDTRQAAARLVLRDVSVDGDELVVTLGL